MEITEFAYNVIILLEARIRKAECNKCLESYIDAGQILKEECKRVTGFYPSQPLKNAGCSVPASSGEKS